MVHSKSYIQYPNCAYTYFDYTMFLHDEKTKIRIKRTMTISLQTDIEMFCLSIYVVDKSDT